MTSPPCASPARIPGRILSAITLLCCLSAAYGVPPCIPLSSPIEQASGEFGSSVSGVPDVNGDFRAELAIGAAWESSGGSPSKAGRVHVYDLTLGERIHTLVSPHEAWEGQFGGSVSGVEDVDGDSRGDVIVGAHGESVGDHFDAGRAYVFNGDTGALIHQLTPPAGTEENAGRFGYSVSGVPDFNADWRGDIVVGAVWQGAGGKAYTFSGATGLLANELVSPDPHSGGDFGFSVAGVPDANGDGHGDVVVGAPAEAMNSGGRAYLFDGTSSDAIFWLGSIYSNSEGRFGHSVAGIPDINGDGLGDVIVGAPGEYKPGAPASAGLAYIFSGAGGTIHLILRSPYESAGGGFGYSVSGMPDVNGNGFGEVVVGAYGETVSNTIQGAGRAYVFDGSTGQFLYEMRSPTPEQDGYFGISVAALGDVGDNGYPDVVVGARWESGLGGAATAGRSYLFYDIEPHAEFSFLQRFKISASNWSGVYLWSFRTSEYYWTGDKVGTYEVAWPQQIGEWLGVFIYDSDLGGWTHAGYPSKSSWR